MFQGYKNQHVQCTCSCKGLALLSCPYHSLSRKTRFYYPKQFQFLWNVVQRLNEVSEEFDDANNIPCLQGDMSPTATPKTTPIATPSSWVTSFGSSVGSTTPNPIYYIVPVCNFEYMHTSNSSYILDLHGHLDC